MQTLEIALWPVLKSGGGDKVGLCGDTDSYTYLLQFTFTVQTVIVILCILCKNIIFYNFFSEIIHNYNISLNSVLIQ